jgi:tetratricopeptide (TPR) repeat protein
MKFRDAHVGLLSSLLAITLTCAPAAVFPAPPAGRAQAVADLEHRAAARRAEAVAWLGEHGRMADQPLLLKRLRDDDEFVRDLAEQGLWALWSRSGEPAIDRLLADGIAQLQTGRFEAAIAAFSDIIRRKPAFAEGWNKRATAYYLAGDYQRSLRDCGEVLQRNPQHFGALSGYGQIYFQLEQYDKALEYWRRALEVNPNLRGVASSIERVEELLKERRERAI